MDSSKTASAVPEPATETLPAGLLSADLTPRSSVLAPPPKRRLLLGAAGGLVAIAIGTVGWTLWPDSGPPKEKLAAIRIGPFADMPEIKDGVPALATKPVRVIATTGAATLSADTAQAGASPAAPATVVAMSAGPAAAPAKAGELRSASPTIESLLDPAKPAPKVPAPTRSASLAPPSGQGAVTSPTTTSTIPSAAAIVPPGLQARRLPAASPTAAALPPTGRPETVAPHAAAEPATPLPPRAPERSAAQRKPEAKPERSAAQRPRQAAASAPVATTPAEAAPAPAAPKGEQSVEFLGLPVPFGREIRDAAQSFADVVTGGPGKF